MMQLSARAGDRTMRRAEQTSCLEHMAKGRASRWVSRAMRTSARCRRYDSRGTVSIDTRSRCSFMRPFWITRSTSWFDHGNCCSSTSLKWATSASFSRFISVFLLYYLNFFYLISNLIWLQIKVGFWSQ